MTPDDFLDLPKDLFNLLTAGMQLYLSLMPANGTQEGPLDMIHVQGGIDAYEKAIRPLLHTFEEIIAMEKRARDCAFIECDKSANQRSCSNFWNDPREAPDPETMAEISTCYKMNQCTSCIASGMA